MTDNRTLPPEQSRTYTHLLKPEKIAPSACDRCGGAGGYTGWPGFTCLRCVGNGIDPTYKNWAFPPTFSLDEMLAFYDDKDQKNARARERYAEKKQVKRDEQLAKNIATYPGFGDIVDSIELEGELTGNRFIDDVYFKSYEFDLTPAQATAVIESFAQDQKWAEEEESRRASIPAIKEADGVIIEGEIITMKYQENQWGSQLKMLVEEYNGQRLWGTVPASLSEADEGMWVEFIANVKPSGDDPIFGFFSRPRKGEILDDGRSQPD